MKFLEMKRTLVHCILKKYTVIQEKSTQLRCRVEKNKCFKKWHRFVQQHFVANDHQTVQSRYSGKTRKVLDTSNLMFKSENHR